MLTFEAKLCEIDKPTNGRLVYTTECIEKALGDPCLVEQLENNCCFVYREDGIGSYTGRDISKICGLVRGFKIKDGGLYAELEDLSDKGLKPKIDSKCKFSPVGVGNLCYDETLDAYRVEDYTMDAVCLVLDKENKNHENRS